jgi:Fe-S-cluster-containing hydrogenase component 2
MEEKGIIIQTFCQQCEDAACIAACPVSAIAKSESAGTIKIDHELCILCEECIAACPFNGIYRDGMDEKIIACDLCDGDPKCVKYCETKAIEFLEKDPVAVQKKKDSQKELVGLLILTKEYTDGPGS